MLSGYNKIFSIILASDTDLRNRYKSHIRTSQKDDRISRGGHSTSRKSNSSTIEQYKYSIQARVLC